MFCYQLKTQREYLFFCLVYKQNRSLLINWKVSSCYCFPWSECISSVFSFGSGVMDRSMFRGPEAYTSYDPEEIKKIRIFIRRRLTSSDTEPVAANHLSQDDLSFNHRSGMFVPLFLLIQKVRWSETYQIVQKTFFRWILGDCLNGWVILEK